MSRRPWTPDELRTLRERYPNERAMDVAKALGRPVGQVHQTAQRYGIAKSEAFKASDLSERVQRGKQCEAMRATQFKPGQVPANKGLRRPGWAPGRMRETQFKKGSMSGAAQHNYVPIGTERISKDGYLERKVTDDHPVPARRWVAVHRLVWEAANGPIPTSHAVVFRKGMRTTLPSEITKERLELVSRAELMRRNTIHRYPRELKQTIRLVGKLRRAIEERSDEKQD